MLKQTREFSRGKIVTTLFVHNPDGDDVITDDLDSMLLDFVETRLVPACRGLVTANDGDMTTVKYRLGFEYDSTTFSVSLEVTLNQGELRTQLLQLLSSQCGALAGLADALDAYVHHKHHHANREDDVPAYIRDFLAQTFGKDFEGAHIHDLSGLGGLGGYLVEVPRTRS